MRNGHTEALGEPAPERGNWEEFGFEPAEASGWTALGFGPFEVALARGDGYTPMVATHYTRQLQKSWGLPKDCAGTSPRFPPRRRSGDRNSVSAWKGQERSGQTTAAPPIGPIRLRGRADR